MEMGLNHSILVFMPLSVCLIMFYWEILREETNNLSKQVLVIGFGRKTNEGNDE